MLLCCEAACTAGAAGANAWVAVEPADAADGESSPESYSARCGEVTCTGCCDLLGVCRPGEADQACGQGGEPCADCLAVEYACSSRVCVNPRRLGGGRVDDSKIHLRSQEDVARMRRDLVRFIWREQGFPAAKMPASVELDVESPVRSMALPSLASVDRLRVDMEQGLVSFIYHLHSTTPNGRLVIVHHGHTDTLDLGGVPETIGLLLEHGYAVLALYMPRCGDNLDPNGFGLSEVERHNALLATEQPDLPYHPVKFFVEPIAVALNYVRAEYGYQDYGMTGLSGGGWTTTLYAAIDPTVRHSYPVAGSLPLHLREEERDRGDAEQELEDLYAIAGYLDLYVLGAIGEGRKQVQVVNRHDACCFGGLAYRTFETQVRAAAAAGRGSYEVFLDESHTGHVISPYALDSRLIHEIDDDGIRIADDTIPVYGAFCSLGDWTTAMLTGGFGGTLLSARPGTGSSRATWAFALAPGTYRVSATWAPHAEGATDAVYRLAGEPVHVNQQLPPTGRSGSGATWTDLGEARVVAYLPLVVTLGRRGRVRHRRCGSSRAHWPVRMRPVREVTE